MTYVDDIESDLSRFHRLDLWAVSFAWALRLAPKLPAYGGALALAMTRAEQSDAPTAPVLELSTGYPQSVDSSTAQEGDTPPEVVARLWESVLRKEYPNAEGFRQVSGEEMERMIASGR